MERARFGGIIKKGSNVKCRVSDLVIEENEKFRKSLVTIKGLKNCLLKKFDESYSTFHLFIPSFDGIEVAT